jgi:RNA polymerase sigma factor (sigma-70 family)
MTIIARDAIALVGLTSSSHRRRVLFMIWAALLSPRPGMQDHQFHTTRWSLVINAAAPSAGGATAMAELCDMYWYPLYAYVRRRGYSPEQAEDLTQSFFARLLEHDLVKVADPTRGKFRSFLLKSLSNYLSNARDHDDARKRGGGQRIVPIDTDVAERRYGAEAADGASPERVFERQWALTVLAQALSSVREHYCQGDAERTFDVLKGFLLGGDRTRAQDEEQYRVVCQALQISPEAARAAVHRLRTRYRRALRSTIAQTLDDESGVDDEIRSLFRAVAR